MSRRRRPDGGIRVARSMDGPKLLPNNAIDSRRQLFISFDAERRRRLRGSAVYTSNHSVARYPLCHPAEAKGVKQGGHMAAGKCRINAHRSEPTDDHRRVASFVDFDHRRLSNPLPDPTETEMSLGGPFRPANRKLQYPNQQPWSLVE